jgi:hypothetical protein
MNSSPTSDISPFLSLFRVVKSNPPTEDDFLSFQALGIPLRRQTTKGLRLWSGLSVYRAREQAADLGARSPHLGRFVAEVRLPLDGSFRLELDNGKDGHCTIWGEPEALLALVVSVWPI